MMNDYAKSLSRLVGTVYFSGLFLIFLLAGVMQDSNKKKEEISEDMHSYIQKVLYPDEDVFIKEQDNYQFVIQGENADDMIMLEIKDNGRFNKVENN